MPHIITYIVLTIFLNNIAADNWKFEVFEPSTAERDLSCDHFAYPDFKDITGFTKFQLDSVHAHNQYRYIHDSDPITLNQTLCDVAQQWANTLASENIMKHSENGKYGENLYATSNKDNMRPVASWYAEESKYTYGGGDLKSETFHFTQVVWHSAKQIGIAMQTTDDGRTTYVVANYDRGNLMGAFDENVLKPVRRQVCARNSTNQHEFQSLSEMNFYNCQQKLESKFEATTAEGTSCQRNPIITLISGLLN